MLKIRKLKWMFVILYIVEKVHGGIFVGGLRGWARGVQDFCRSTRILNKFYNLQHKCDKNLHIQTIFKSTIYHFFKQFLFTVEEDGFALIIQLGRVLGG